MDSNITNHHLLPDGYIVQPVENIPVSVIDYDKIEITQLIHSGQITNATPVIQLTDLNSNLKSKTLHPLEVEIQRDYEIKQQQHQVLTKHIATSVIQCPEQAGSESCSKAGKGVEATTQLYDGVMQLQTLPRETVLNVNPTKAPENMICHISPVNAPFALQKRQFIIVSDNSMLLNLAPKENKIEQKQVINEVSNEFLSKPAIQTDLSIILDNYNNSSVSNSDKVADGTKKVTVESDSENEEEDIEPVYDYEPDPDVTTKVNAEQVEKPNKCYMCFRSFRQKKNMYAHIRKIHSTQPKIEEGILCPLCKMHALRQVHLRNHLETLHDIPIEKEERLFNTMEEFLSWKEFVERETLSFYVSKSSSKLLANNQQKTYYKCHRSGNYISHKKENRKKKLKFQGSNKIGATCPAAMELTENTNGLNVTFWKTHVGHDNDLAHLVLTKEDRAKIMGLYWQKFDYIVSGVSWDKIIEKIKKDEAKTSAPPSRLTIVSKQDLRNLKKIHDMRNTPDLYAGRKKNIQGRKPMKEKMLRRASQALVIEKADMLLNLLETTDVRPEFRPKICLMIDNLISTVKRRAVKLPKRDIQKRKQWVRCDHSETLEDREQRGSVNKMTSVSGNDTQAAIGSPLEKVSTRKTTEVKSTTAKHSIRENVHKKV